MTAREEILIAARDVTTTNGKNEFTISEVWRYMKDNGTQKSQSTIRTHISSRLCANAPDNHGVTYNDFERVRKGVYKRL